MIKLSTRCRYGMIAIAELAKQYNKEPLSAEEIFRKHRIPKSYLEQLLVRLRRHNLISSQRGPQGGFILKKHPRKITVLEIINALEGPLDLVACCKQSCWNIDGCLTRSIWLDLNKSLNAVLRKKTLADIVR